MADSVKVEYLYPPTIDGQVDEFSGNRRVIVRLSGVSDGTGETGVTKIRLSDLRINGKAPTRSAAEWIQFSASGMVVLLYWDRSPAAEIYRVSSDDSGSIDWTQFGGKVDPGGDDRTGDVLITTTETDNGDTYDITLCLRLKE